jgi:hypothetical protein
LAGDIFGFPLALHRTLAHALHVKASP